MAFTDRSWIIRRRDTTEEDQMKIYFATGLLAILAVTLAMRAVLPADALTPAVATLFFALGGLAALLAFCRHNRRTRTTWFDIAGILTFVGVAVSLLIEPDQLVRLIVLSDQPD